MEERIGERLTIDQLSVAVGMPPGAVGAGLRRMRDREGYSFAVTKSGREHIWRLKALPGDPPATAGTGEPLVASVASPAPAVPRLGQSLTVCGLMLDARDNLRPLMRDGKRTWLVEVVGQS